MKEQLKILKKHILTGTSHMIPFIVAGGILFSLAVMLNPAGAATPETGWLAGLAQIGLGGLTLFVPVLGGYIAYSIADKPGLAPGMIGAYLAKEMGAGFLGGMAAGLIAGVVVKELKSKYRKGVPFPYFALQNACWKVSPILCIFYKWVPLCISSSRD